MVLLLFLAGASLYFSYVVYPTKEWLMLYDPLQLEVYKTSIVIHPYIGIGFFIEFFRIIIAIGILYLVFRLEPSETLQTLKKKFPKRVISTNGIAKEVPTKLREISKLPRFLWGPYPVVPFAVFVAVLFVNLIVGPQSLKTDLSEECFPRQPIISSFVKSTVPGGTPTMTTTCTGYLGKDAYYKAGERTKLWQISTTSNQFIPYLCYLAYSTIMYLFLILPIMVNLWRALHVFLQNLRKIVYYIKEANENALETYEKHKIDLLDMLSNFLNPTGWTLLSVIVLMLYEGAVGSITLSGTARMLVFATTFTWTLGSLIFIALTLNLLEKLSIFFSNQALEEGIAKERKERLLVASNATRPETVLESREMSFIWRVIGRVWKFISSLSKIREGIRI